MVMYNIKWEQIGGGVWRLETPKGWLVTDNDLGIAYVPDPDKDWMLKDEEE
jgi:hypothetical protein